MLMNNDSYGHDNAIRDYSSVDSTQKNRAKALEFVVAAKEQGSYRIPLRYSGNSKNVIYASNYSWCIAIILVNLVQMKEHKGRITVTSTAALMTGGLSQR